MRSRWRAWDAVKWLPSSRRAPIYFRWRCRAVESRQPSIPGHWAWQPASLTTAIRPCGALSLLGQRVFALALGYEDINDHDRLRDDSLLALALDGPDLTGQSRRRERDRGHALAGSSTLNRLELGTLLEADEDRYKKVVASTEQIDDHLFLNMHETLPERIVLDVDATDDQLHGQQEGRFYHGYYRHYCYLPLYITCGEHVLCARLRTAQAEAAEGTVAELDGSCGASGSAGRRQRSWCAGTPVFAGTRS